MAYVTELQLEEAKALGFDHVRSLQNGDSFNKDSRVIWSIQTGWQTADLINGSYCNHEKFIHFDDAINRP